MGLVDFLDYLTFGCLLVMLWTAPTTGIEMCKNRQLLQSTDSLLMATSGLAPRFGPEVRFSTKFVRL